MRNINTIYSYIAYNQDHTTIVTACTLDNRQYTDSHTDIQISKILRVITLTINKWVVLR